MVIPFLHHYNLYLYSMNFVNMTSSNIIILINVGPYSIFMIIIIIYLFIMLLLLLLFFNMTDYDNTCSSFVICMYAC